MKEITQEKVNIHCEYFVHELLREAVFCEIQAHKRWAEAVEFGLPSSNGARALESAAERCRELARFFNALPSREAIDKFFESWDYGPYQQVENDLVYKFSWYWHEAKRLGALGNELVAAKDGKKAWIALQSKTGKSFFKPMIAWGNKMPVCQEIYGLGFSDRMEWRRLTIFDTSNPLIARLAGTGDLWTRKKLEKMGIEIPEKFQ